MLTVPGGKLRARPTLTFSVSPMNPGADAVILTVPNLEPITEGCTAGVSACAAMKTLFGVTVAIVGSALVKVIVAPPNGAGVARVTEYATVCPGLTAASMGRIIFPTLTTFTPTEPLV